MREVDFYIELMTNLIYWRKERGLTQNDIAIRLGIERSHVANLEVCRARINSYHIWLWCQACNVHISYVWPGCVKLP